MLYFVRDNRNDNPGVDSNWNDGGLVLRGVRGRT